MIYGPDYKLKRFLGVSLLEYCFLNILWMRRKTVDEGWINMDHQSVANQLDVDERTVRRISASLQDKQLLFKKNQRTCLYRLPESLEDLITDDTKWQIAYSGFSSFSELVTDKMSTTTEDQQRTKCPEATDKMSDTTIYSKYINNRLMSDPGESKPEEKAKAEKKQPNIEITNVISLLLDFVKKNFGQNDFAESRDKQRRFGKFIVGLKLSPEEITRRCSVLAQIPWRRGKFSHLYNLYEQLKSFSSSVEKEVEEVKGKEETKKRMQASAGDKYDRSHERMNALTSRTPTPHSTFNSALDPQVVVQKAVRVWLVSEGEALPDSLKINIDALPDGTTKRWCQTQVAEKLAKSKQAQHEVKSL